MEQLQSFYQKTIDFAARAHGDQQVPGTPYSYIVHPACVAMEILVAAQHETIHDLPLAVQCALLHDVLEDTDTGYNDLREFFGEAVARGVASLTKDSSLAKAEAMADSLRRIMEQPDEIGMVKLADRITNLQKPPSCWTDEKKAYYREEARLIHRELQHCNDYLARRLLDRIDCYGE